MLAETRGTIAAPVPANLHTVTAYAPADLAATAADFDRAGAGVGTFSTDANLDPQTFTFDVTSLAVAAAGGTLGFRVQLVADPNLSSFGALGSSFDVTLALVAVPVPVRFELVPHSLTLASRGASVTGFIEPPAPFAASDIDIASIRLNGTVAVDPAAPTSVGDHDGNGVADLMVKFDRAALEHILPEGDDVPVVVTGALASRTFTGTDHVRVHHAGSAATSAGGPLVHALGVSAPVPHGLAVRTAAAIRAQGGRLRLEFTLEDASPARLDLVDLAGRVLTTTHVESLGPGTRGMDLSSGQALSPRIYFLRLTQNGHEARTKVAVIR